MAYAALDLYKSRPSVFKPAMIRQKTTFFEVLLHNYWVFIG